MLDLQNSNAQDKCQKFMALSHDDRVKNKQPASVDRKELEETRSFPPANEQSKAQRWRAHTVQAMKPTLLIIKWVCF